MCIYRNKRGGYLDKGFILADGQNLELGKRRSGARTDASFSYYINLHATPAKEKPAATTPVCNVCNFSEAPQLSESYVNGTTCDWVPADMKKKLKGTCIKCIRHELIFGLQWPRRIETAGQLRVLSDTIDAILISSTRLKMH